MAESYQIHISGRVQGVGFRPFIFNLAKTMKLKGFVSNDKQGVVILIQCKQKDAENFLNQIKQSKPANSEIISSEIHQITSQEVFSTFFIKPTPENTQVNSPLTPDFAICYNCQKELLDKQNRRYFYPFITCTQCGPRYALTEKFPFERENTSISEFIMCSDCLKEYESPENTRFHSQTNTCPDCGIKIKLTNHLQEVLSENSKDIFNILAEQLSLGKIIAVKNTSGYLLLCDATNSKTVQELRKRKRRPSKPLAVLFPDLNQIENHLWVKETHKKEFLSPESPIQLIKIKNPGNLAVNEIAPDLNTIGAIFPYTGMLQLITLSFGKPLISTSANLHGSPICSSEKEAIEHLNSVADFFIHHTLDILHPQDDSVIKYSEKFNRKIILRRSRGYAPNYLFTEELQKKNPENQKIICLGGDLKNTFTLIPNTHCYISEYLGDLTNFDTYLRFEKAIQSYQKLFSFQADCIISDLHPLYENLKIIPQLNSNKTSKYKIQHHEAHFTAILGEHRLWDSKDPVMGIVWDGTGFYSENEIRGSEFFIYKNYRIKSVTRLKEFSWISGDKMSRTPKLSALSISKNSEYFRNYFTDNEWNIYTKLISEQKVKTSSMGRLFDAVSLVLGYKKETISFEGEAALWLETIASAAFENDNCELTDYLKTEPFTTEIPAQALLLTILKETKKQTPEKIALNFHYTLIKAIEKIAKREQIQKLAFSGGVFQNSILVDLAIQLLTPEFTLYFHEQLSPNDENISFGQLNHYLNIKKYNL